MARLPLFPLGTVLVPGATLPLQVFEDRYRRLVRDLLDGPEAPEFGVVAITAGHEVGEGKARQVASIGCTAVLQHVDSLRPGVYRLKTRGAQRFRVRRILTEDPAPYLVAEVAWLPENDGDTDKLPALARQVRERLYQYCDMIGAPTPAGFEPLQRRDLEAARRISYGLLDHMVLPVGEQLRLLETDTTENRLRLARALLRREIDLYQLFRALPYYLDPSEVAPN